ncbi:MAG: Mut7-C RNAse domain-containing protein [Candidatus Thorarchaeota archaeon]
MTKKFVVDAMFGKVALWLRLTGHDTVYTPTIEDDYALELAINEDRIMITADEELHKRGVEANVKGLLLRGDVDERIATVFREYSLRPEIDPDLSRCSKCNGILEKLEGDSVSKVKPHVHEQTFNHYKEFWFCNDCQGVYFQGGLWDNMIEYMTKIRNLMS